LIFLLPIKYDLIITCKLEIAEKRAATKTVGAVPMNNATRAFFASGPLRYEYQLYAFTRQLFNERLRRSGIESIATPYGVPPVN